MDKNRENLERDVKRLAEIVNRYAAGVALVIPAFVAISTSVVKYLTYIRMKGRTDYFSVPSTTIEVFNQNILFDFIYSSVIFAVILFNTYVFFLVFRRKDISLFQRAKLYLLAFGIVLFINYMVFLASTEPVNVSVGLTIFNSLNAFIIYLRFRIQRKKAKIQEGHTDNTHLSNTEHFQQKAFRILAYFILVFALLGSMLYYDARMAAEKERTFRMIDDTYIVVYENRESFYTDKCTVCDGAVTIFTNVQRQYLKTDVETEWKTFSNVVLQSEQN